MKKNKIFINNIKKIFNYLIIQNGLLLNSSKIKKIIEVLFFDFNYLWMASNQKFDFSFSFKSLHAKALRFSYNNYGEKKQFNQKVFEIFSLFDDVYDCDAIYRMLDELKCVDANFQTTIGMEWVSGCDYPRIKIYFEEIHQTLSQEQRIEMLKKIVEIISCDFSLLAIKYKLEIGAICVDFLPNKKFNIKVYYKSNQINWPILNKCIDKELLSFVKIFSQELSLEKKSFYYSTTRYNLKKMTSIKLYKIYEIMKIDEFSLVFKEIFQLLRKINFSTSKREFFKFMKFISATGLHVYPVIASIDVCVEGDYRFDLYLTIKDF